MAGRDLARTHTQMGSVARRIMLGSSRAVNFRDESDRQLQIVRRNLARADHAGVLGWVQVGPMSLGVLADREKSSWKTASAILVADA